MGMHDMHVDQAARAHAPGMAERFHVNERRHRHGLGLLAQAQLVLQPRELTERTRLPPAPRWRIAVIFHLRSAANLNLLTIDDGAKTGQLAVQHDRSIDLAIVRAAKKSLL